MHPIPVYSAFETDFSTNGLGLIQPTACVVEERMNGLYDLTCEIPIDDEGRFRLLGVGRILRVPAPVCEAPLQLDDGVRDVYIVSRSWARLRSLPAPRGGSLGRYRYGEEAALLEDAGESMRVRMLSDGAVGYVRKSDVRFFRRAALEKSASQRASKEQLFRIDTVETDTVEGLVFATARHIFYDLKGFLIEDPCDIDAWTGGELVLREVFDTRLRAEPRHALRLPEPFDAPVRLKAGGKSIVAALLDEGGIVRQLGGAIVRDNFDVYVLPGVARDAGVTIRRGKNLLGLNATVDATRVVTEIIAYAYDAEGRLARYGEPFLSPNAEAVPYPLTETRVYDFQPGTADTPTEADVLRAVEDAVAREFASGADRPRIDVQVDLLLPGAEEERAALEGVHMFDVVRVIDETIGLDVKLRVTGYRWNVCTEQFEQLTLGNQESVSDDKLVL